jgi:hypothetical protein
MSERLGGEGVARDTFPLGFEFIQVVVDEEGEWRYKLGRVDTVDGEEYEVYLQQVCNLIDSMLSVLGIEPASWKKHAESLSFDHSTDKTISGRRLAASTHDPRTTGNRLHDAAYDDMPMENSNDGVGGASIRFQLQDGYRLELVGEGEYGHSYSYAHPLSKEPISESEYLRLESSGEFDSSALDDSCSGHHWHWIEFSAVVTKSEQASAAA